MFCNFLILKDNSKYLMKRKRLNEIGNVFSGKYIEKEYLEETGKILYLSY